MINTMQWAIIKKDLRNVTSNKQVFTTMLIVPLALAIILPSIFILVIHFVPKSTEDFQKLLDILPIAEQEGSNSQMVTRLFLNKIMPVFFLIIPVMASSVMAASSFVGEKEKKTLETLLYCPLSLRQVFHAKILVSFLVSMIVSFMSCAAMILIVETEIFLTSGSMILPDIGWLVTMFLVSPSISLIAITLTVKGSAKAQTIEEAQQRAVFLVFPVIFLVIGQFTGMLMISIWILLGLGLVLAFLAGILIRGAMGKFSYETLLR